MNPSRLDEATILAALRQVYDPEIACNIVDLGLIYGLACDGSTIRVTMTLTTAGCPMHESIAWGVQNALGQLDGVEAVQVEIVSEPPWHTAMMTDAGRAVTGVK